jgi:hypothetical protein
LIDEQSKTFFKTELVRVGGFHLRTEGIGQTVQFHGNQFLHGGLIQHVFPPEMTCYCTSLLGET